MQTNSPSAAPVRVDHLSHRYGDRLALQDVTFDVAPSEIVALLGPNGSGKSTLFRVLCTLSPPQEGAVTVLGHDLAREAGRVRPSLGVVFQSPALDPQLTAEENLLHHGHLYGLRGRDLRDRAAEALKRFGLAGRASERIWQFSGGMQRRVELAKATLHRPRVLLMDEPSTGLDPAARLDLWNHLDQLRSGGVTVLLTTHLMDEADRCDRVAILDAGRLVAIDTPAALKAGISGDVLSVVTSNPDAARAALREKLGIDDAVTADHTSLRIERPQAHELIPRVIEALPGLVRSVSVGRPTLEDVFLRLTGRRFE